jgi:DNA-binding transcriptional LysR family regulator
LEASLDFRDLVYFRTIAELGHMGQAAERLFLTQPALTKAMQRLEESIEGKIFLREGRGIALTELGRVLLERSRVIEQMMNATHGELRGFARGEAGHIRFGCAPTLAKYYLPEIMRQLLDQSPGVTIDLETNVSGPLLKALREHRLDAVLTHVTGPIDGFHVTPVMDDEVAIVASWSHPLAAREVQVPDLTHYNWVLPTKSAILPWLQDLFHRHGCPAPKAQVKATSILYLPSLIGGTQLLSLLSTKNLKDDVTGQHLTEINVAGERLRRSFAFVCRDPASLSPATRLLFDIIRDSTAPCLGGADKISS